ncbi:hypothetical protein ACLOJK_007164 [Asimina triloba]
MRKKEKEGMECITSSIIIGGVAAIGIDAGVALPRKRQCLIFGEIKRLQEDRIMEDITEACFLRVDHLHYCTAAIHLMNTWVEIKEARRGSFISLGEHHKKSKQNEELGIISIKQCYS